MKNRIKTGNPEERRIFSSLKPKILVVENDLALSQLLEDVFEEYGFAYKIFSDTTDILPLVKEFQPDLVLLDYMLPLINGGELCGQIKRNKETSNIPVIIFSAFPKVLLSLGNYGCDAFIAKPFDLDYLIGQFNKHLQKPAGQKRNTCQTA